MNKSLNLCIDFGTSNSVVSYMFDNDFQCKQILDNISNNELIPSIIYFVEDELIRSNNISVNNMIPNVHYYIGTCAKEVYTQEKKSEYYFYQFKRLLGITSKSINLYKDFLENSGYEYLLEDDILFIVIKYNFDSFIKISITDLIMLFFKGLKHLISDRLNIVNDNETTEIILTCPAYFHDLQRSQLKKSAEDAGFKIYKLYNEPTAAAIYYVKNYNFIESCEEVKSFQNKKFMIYDLGGGTIDTTVIEYYPENDTCEVIDIDGNNSLGGIDIDNILYYDIIKKYNIDVKNKKWYLKIKNIAEEFKIKLTWTTNYKLVLEDVPIIKINNTEYVDCIEISYSRQQFNNLINSLVDTMILPIISMYKKHEITYDNIIFIGGPTHIPLLRNKISALFSDSSSCTLVLAGSTSKLSAILKGDTDTIVRKETSNPLLHKTIVSMGGAVMHKLLKNNSNFCLLDIIPMNIGISGPNNDMIVIINKNSKIPTSCEKIFSTVHDCQRSIDIEVYEGVDNDCKNNTFLGSYKIIGIPPLPRGHVLLKLELKISYNGILNINFNGYKNPLNSSKECNDFKMCENIRLISMNVAKKILKQLLLSEKK